MADARVKSPLSPLFQEGGLGELKYPLVSDLKVRSTL